MVSLYSISERSPKVSNLPHTCQRTQAFFPCKGLAFFSCPIAPLHRLPLHISPGDCLIDSAAMSFSQVPDEIIQHLLYYISPEDTLASFQLISHRLRRLANEPLLWRYHCQSNFKFWHPEHRFHQRLRDRAPATPWKKLFIIRKCRNAQINRLLDEILATKVGRLRRFEKVCRLGYDAKDFLLEQCDADDSIDDHLARR